VPSGWIERQAPRRPPGDRATGDPPERGVEGEGGDRRREVAPADPSGHDRRRDDGEERDAAGARDRDPGDAPSIAAPATSAVMIVVATATSVTSGSGRRRRAPTARMNAASPAASAEGHRRVRAANPYAVQNDATPIVPSIAPAAACAANGAPRSAARKQEIGPEVSGSPVSIPPTRGP